MDLSLIIKRRALEIGFDLVGVAGLEAARQDLEFARAWVNRGLGGTMDYLKNPKRDDPRRILPSAKSGVCVGLVYNTPFPYSTEVGEGQVVKRTEDSEAGIPERCALGADCAAPHPEQSRAWISRYAWGRDYHEVMRAKLEQLRAAMEELAPGVETRVYVDTGPVVERALARFSGIGWMGKNTCLINEEKGSWFFLGVILTSLELPPDQPAPDRCGSCTRCLQACPTGALIAPYVMDASRCISYFTIELKESIPADYRRSLGPNVFGCDICQDVCPWNRPLSLGDPQRVCQGKPGLTRLAEFRPLVLERARTQAAPTTEGGLPAQPGTSLFRPPLEFLASLTEEDFRRLFAHSPLQRAKYRGWLRNLCIAAGNSRDRRLVPWLERLRCHPDATVSEHAAWALQEILGSPAA